MPHGGPHNDGSSYSIDPDLEGDFMGQYGRALGEFTLQAPQLLERSAERERQALEQARRTGMMSLAQQAAESRAATVGGAGQMALGGGRNRGLRQAGLTFGRSAADFAADAFQRAAGLEADITNRRLQMMGELIPGALLARYDAAQSPQDEAANIINQVGTMKENSSGSELIRTLYGLLVGLRPGSQPYRYVASELLAEVDPDAPGFLVIQPGGMTIDQIRQSIAS